MELYFFLLEITLSLSLSPWDTERGGRIPKKVSLAFSPSLLSLFFCKQAKSEIFSFLARLDAKKTFYIKIRVADFAPS